MDSWIRLRGSLRARSSLSVEWGRCDSLPTIAGRVELSPDEWEPFRIKLATRLIVWNNCFFSTLGDPEPVEEAARRLCAARTLLFDWLVSRVPLLDSDESVLAIRSLGLLEMPLAPIVADARPKRAFARLLPFDVHPEVSDATPLAKLCALSWPTPKQEEMTIFVGSDLNETGACDCRGNEHLAAVAIWRLQIERAVSAAEQRGARVVRGFTMDELLGALEGDFGPHLQVIAESKNEHTPHGIERCVLASDAAISLPALLQQARERNGPPPSLIAADLVTCRSATTFAPVLAAMSVPFVSSVPSVWHSAYVAALLQHLYGEGGTVDGRTWLAHAWIIASKRLFFGTTTGLPEAQTG